MAKENKIRVPQAEKTENSDTESSSFEEKPVHSSSKHEALEDAEKLLRLILGLSTNFICLPPDDVDDGIKDVLKAIGSFAGVERSYVFQFVANEKEMIKTHEWSSLSIEAGKQVAQLLSHDSFPWLFERIKNYEEVHVPDVSEMPSEAGAEREFFLREGIQSIVAVPVMSGYSVMGFVGFESIHSKKVWPENIIALLKMTGEIFAFALSRKNVTEALKESESKYWALFEYANDAISLIKGGKFVDCNTKTLSMFGCSREQIIGHSPMEFSPPRQPDGQDSEEKITEMVNLTLSGEPQFFEWKHCRHDNSPFDAEISFNRIDLGNAVYLQAIIRDITDRKQAGEKLEQAMEDLRGAMGATIQVIVQVVETRDPYTAGHQRRVSDLSRTIATEMRLSRTMIEGVRMAGVIHDIGKISVPAEILSKPGKLTNKEFELIKDHPQTGYNILKDMEFPWPIATIIHQHHERMDGSGYPQKLKGEDILLEARIIAVADVVEAIASYRPYRPALSIDIALEEIFVNKGTLYDEVVVDVCLKLFRNNKFVFK